jgi:hypothetical protein
LTQQEACKKVYRDRILKGTGNGGFYSWKKLGAFGADLAAVAAFFDRPWSQVSPTLSAADQAWLLGEAAFRLRGLGRLTEALEPMRAGLEMRVRQEIWISAAIIANNLSELELTLGLLEPALADAELTVDYADRNEDAFWRMASRTGLVDAQQQAGQAEAAAAMFQAAETIQAERQPDYPLLYSLPGFRYCDLLLAPAERAAWQTLLSFPRSVWECRLGRSAAQDGDAERHQKHSRAERGNDGAVQPALTRSAEADEDLAACRAVTERATQTLDWWLNHFTNPDPLNIALDHLTLARAALYTACLQQTPTQPAHAATLAAVDGLRRAGTIYELPRGLLTRALLRRLDHALTGADSAQADLDEAWEIAERGPMPLFLADIHLHRARLYGLPDSGPYPWQSPAEDLAAARRLIEKHGYRRRLAELADAEAALLPHRHGPTESKL